MTAELWRVVVALVSRGGGCRLWLERWARQLKFAPDPVRGYLDDTDSDLRCEILRRAPA